MKKAVNRRRDEPKSSRRVSIGAIDDNVDGPAGCPLLTGRRNGRSRQKKIAAQLGQEHARGKAGTEVPVQVQVQRGGAAHLIDCCARNWKKQKPAWAGWRGW